jgi:low affinity Fe/Cu permease
MKKTIIALFAAMFVLQFTACNSGATMDSAAMDKKIDSLKQAKLEELQTTMDKECQDRMKAEVMTVADSIYKSMKAPQKNS